MKTTLIFLWTVLTFGTLLAAPLMEQIVLEEKNFILIEESTLGRNEVLDVHFSKPNGRLVWMPKEESSLEICGKVRTNGHLEIYCASEIFLTSEAVIESQGIKITSRERISHGGSMITHGSPLTLVGPHIEILEKSSINTSGNTHGGCVSIGGGWHGKDPGIPNAQAVLIDPSSNIITDALLDGVAGDVVVWSDNLTRFQGNISSKGNRGGGNVEVSSKDILLFDGTVDLSSSNGQQGTLLIDPATIVVQASNPDIQGNGSNLDITTPNELANPATYPGANSIITAGAIDSLLTGGVSMTLSATNSITINSPVTASGVVTTFSLNAPTVNLNQPISLPSGGVLDGTPAIVNVGPFGNIQNGVDVVAVGGTVNLASATYIQEVYIGKNLTLNGSGIGNSIIRCPTSPAPLTNSFLYTINGATYHPMILAEGASNIIIQNLTVDGNSQPTNFLNFRFVGIGYHNAGGTIQNTYVTNIEDGFPAGPTQHGFSILGAIDSGNYTIQVLNNIMDRFQKQAISMRGPTLTTTISGNIITGETPPSAATMNGIVISNSATATIINNNLYDILSATPGVDSVAIFLISAAPNTLIANNSVTNSNIGIYSLTSGNNLGILNNNISTFTTFGVYVQDTDGLTSISKNTITCSGVPSNGIGITVEDPDTGAPIGIVFSGAMPTYNMYLYSSTNQPFQLSGNIFNPCDVGLAAEGTGAVGPQVTMNQDIFNGEPTFYIQLINNPNNTWPSTASVSFSGLVSGYITFQQYLYIQSHLDGQFQDGSLGIILEYLQPFSPQPPIPFVGILTKDKLLNKTNYCLKTSWANSSSPNVIIYNIYYNGKIVEQIEAGTGNIFNTSLKHKKDAELYAITSVNTFGLESTPTPLVIND